MQNDYLDLQTPYRINQHTAKLAQLFSNWVTEIAEDNAVDFYQLSQELSTPPQALSTPPRELSTPLRNRIEKNILDRINQLSPETEMKAI